MTRNADALADDARANGYMSATSAAAIARFSSTRTRLRRVHRAQTIAVAGCIVVAGLAWTQLVRLDWNMGLIVVPILVACTAGAAFVRKAWAAVLVRASLWASFVCGVAAAVGAHNDLGAKGVVVALPAGVGLLMLGRFSRSLARARPLLVALTALALADATMHGIGSLFMLVDGIRDEGPFTVFTFTAVANVVGLIGILKWKHVWPHIVGNVVVVAMAATDVMGAKPFVNVVIGGAALLQIVLALLLKAPPASARTRRSAERALRVVIVAVLACALWSVAR